MGTDDARSETPGSPYSCPDIGPAAVPATPKVSPVNPKPRRKHRAKTPEMLRHLRLKITLMIMLTSGFVVVLAFSMLFAYRYNNAYRDVHAALENACQVGPSDIVTYSIGKNGGFDKYGRRESSYLPTAVYMIDYQGNVITSNETFVKMDDSIRDLALISAIEASTDEGRLSQYGVFYMRHATAADIVVAFTDATTFDAEIGDTLRLLVLAGVAILVALLLLSLVLSRIATRPVQRAWDDQSKFIADASHELKTPLTVIIANNDIMAAHPEFTTQERAKWLDGTQVEAQHMKGLIEDMLTLARGEQAEPVDPMRLPAQDLSAIVQRSCLAFDAVAFERGVLVEDDVAKGVSVRGDEVSLERMTKILIENAVKYAGNGGHVTVRLTADQKGRPVLSVNNTGTPMSQEDLKHVFDRFWRSDTARTRTSTSGYGLGLAIAKSIADSHRAQISVTSSQAQGTTFKVVFEQHV